MTKEEMENNLAEAIRNLREVKEHLDKEPKKNVKLRLDIGDTMSKINKIEEKIHYL